MLLCTSIGVQYNRQDSEEYLVLLIVLTGLLK
jgi:hypothetical protein